MFKTQKSMIIASVSIAVLILGGAIFGLSQFGARQNLTSTQFSSSSSQNSSQKSPSEGVTVGGGRLLPLQADNEYDVVVLEECDLAIKFPKKVTVPKEFLGYDILKQETIIPSFDNQSFVLKMEKSGDFLTINCNNTSLQKEAGNFDKYIPDFLTKYGYKIATTQIDGGSSFIKVQHSFTKNNKNYTISDLQREKNFSHESLARLFDIQIQPNSLAPSTPSVKLTETPASSAISSAISSLITNPTSTSTNLSINSKSSDNVSKDIVSSSFSSKASEIKLYLGTNKGDCGATSIVTRQIPQTESLVKATLLELFKGENSEEKNKGLSSSFKNWQEVLASVNLKADGTLQIDLKKEVLPQKQADGSFTDKYNWGTFGTSCGSGQMQQIRQTAKQFPSVKYVIFSVNGQLQSPDNFVGCPENASGKLGNLENEKWEELKRQCGL